MTYIFFYLHKIQDTTKDREILGGSIIPVVFL